MSDDEEPISELWKLIRPGGRRRRRSKDKLTHPRAHLEAFSSPPYHVIEAGKPLGPKDLYVIFYLARTNRRSAVTDISFRIEPTASPVLVPPVFDVEDPEVAPDVGSPAYIENGLRLLLEATTHGLGAEDFLNRCRALMAETDAAYEAMARLEDDGWNPNVSNPSLGHYFADMVLAPEAYPPGFYTITWQFRERPGALVSTGGPMVFRITGPDDLTR